MTPSNSTSWNADELRTRFTEALSEMYRVEVPLYGNLVEIVRQVDESILAAQGAAHKDLPVRHQLERHGAIRVGSEDELRVIKQLFAIFGMYPVGYYDLRIVGFPLHATAFRPISEESLARNPFRIFTTVLRKDLVSPDTRVIAERILEKRRLFTPRLLEIIDHAERDKSMTRQDADDLIPEALKIFKWHPQSAVLMDDYLKLKEEHAMIADIACFPSAHINHLTPRTLDIDLVQNEMIKQGLPAKEKIEGPPKRQCPILLRQTSFRALEEQVDFLSKSGATIRGTHTARFGEVEQRGAAVTRKGRDLYDHLLSRAVQDAASKAYSSSNFEDILSNTFSSYPDTWSELRVRGLVYFRYRATPKGQLCASEKSAESDRRVDIEHLLELGLVECEPITYEDFLPLSAAGIFKSNLENEPEKPLFQGSESSLPELERALGCKIWNEFDVYEQLQQHSLRDCKKALRLDEILMDYGSLSTMEAKLGLAS